MYRFVFGASLIFLSAACGTEDTSTLPTPPPPPPPPPGCATEIDGYVSSATFRDPEPWYYRQTVVSTHGPFLGTTRLWRIQWSLEADRLSAVAGSQTIASWPIEKQTDPACERDLRVDWTKSSVENNLFADTAVARSLKFTATAAVNTNIELSEKRIDITESGQLSLDAMTCEDLLGESSGPIACEDLGQLRHVFRPVSSIATLAEPRTVAREFAYFGDEQRVEHMAINETRDTVRFHAAPLGTEQDAAAVAAGQQIDAVFRALWPGASAPRFEVLADRSADTPRLGGLDTNTVTWTTAGGHWASFASRAVDPITGEVVAGDLIIDTRHLEQAVEAVRQQMTDGDPSIEGLLALAQDSSRRTSSAEPDAIVDESDARSAARTTLDAQLAHLRTFRQHAAGSFIRDDNFAGLAAGHDWVPGDLIPAGLEERVWPDDLVARVLDPRGARVTSFMIRAGYSYPSTLGWAGFEHLAVNLAAMDVDEASELIRDGLARHLLLRGLLQLIGLTTNPAASTDALNFPDEFWSPETQSTEPLATSSIMDELPARTRPFATQLGRYDVAALRFLFGEQVEVFETTPPLDVSRLDEFHPQTLAMRFCGEPCPDPAAGVRALTERRFVHQSEVGASGLVAVPHRHCDAATALEAPTPYCGIQDYGASTQEIIGHAMGRWLAHYPFVAFGTPERPVNPAQLMRPAMQVVSYASITAQWLIRRAEEDPSFVQTEQARDWAGTAFASTRFAAEVLSTPQRTRMCPWPNASIYIPWYFLNDCNPDADLDSAYAAAAEMIEIPPGVGRARLFDGGRPWIEAGSYFDKQNILWMLRIVYPTTFPGESQEPGPSLYHLFHEVLDPLYEDVTGVDGYFVRMDVGENLGGYWCRHPDARDVASRGSFMPRDFESGGPPATCIDPRAVYPTVDERMVLNALFWSIALSSPGLDAAANRAKIYRLGMDDGDVVWTQYSAAELCEYTNARIGATYRTIFADHPLGCQLIERARDAYVSWEGSAGNDAYLRNLEAKNMTLELVRALLP